MRAAIYARYSSDLQNAASIEDQLRLCRERIAREDWDLIDTYADAGVSGASRFRPRYQQMLADARTGAFDIVIAEALDRLSRDQEDTAALFKALAFAKVQLITLAEGEISELHVGLKGAMNAIFLKDLAAKTRRGMRGRVEAGYSAGGRCYGYQLLRETNAAGEPIRGRRLIDPAQAAIVQRIFEAFALGKSPRAIARELNHEGILGPDSRPWLDTTIRGHAARGTGILRNELYAGRLIWNRQHFIKDPATGKRLARPNPRTDWIVQEAPDLRIVEDELWTRVELRLGEIAASPGVVALRKTQFWKARRARHLLSGRIFCGGCGHQLSINGTDYLSCGRARRNDLCSNRRSIRRPELEALILDALKANLMAPDLVAEFVRAYHAEINAVRRDQEGGRTAATRQLAETERKLEHLLEALADGIRGPGLQQKLDHLEAERRRLEAVLTQPAPEPVRLHPNLAELYRQKVAELQRAFEQPATRDAAFDILRQLIERVTLHPTGDGFEVELEGEIVAMVQAALQPAALQLAALQLAAGDRSATNDKTALRRFRLEGASARSVKVVAGARFELTTFRL
jgi:site-specific DNA recombinase